MSRNPAIMTDPQQCLGEAIGALRANELENALSLSHRAIELGLDDTTVWGVIASQIEIWVITATRTRQRIEL